MGPLADPLTPVEVAAQHRVCLRTVRRWMRHGVLNGRGARVKLPSRMVGGRRVTCAAWVGQFLAALNPDDAPHAVRTPAELARADRAARAELAKLLGAKS